MSDGTGIMQKKYEVAPSILSSDFSYLGREVQAVEAAGAHRIHIDVMDGRFAPNLSMGAAVVRSIKKVTSLPLDVHLMVMQPDQHIAPFVQAGAHSVTIHVEATHHPLTILKKIRQHKVLAGIAVRPSTAIKDIFPLLDDVDLVLVMTVQPGFSGQKLMVDQVEKMNLLCKELTRRKLSHVKIHADGGINNKVLPMLSSADVLVSGDFIFKHTSYATAISLLHNQKNV